MPEGSNGTAVLVLGMHRSGTSSVAGALIRLGGAAPTHFDASTPGQSEGILGIHPPYDFE